MYDLIFSQCPVTEMKIIYGIHYPLEKKTKDKKKTMKLKTKTDFLVSCSFERKLKSTVTNNISNVFLGQKNYKHK